MRYFFEVIDGSDRVRDHEGGDYVALAAAKAEAEQVARDIAAEHLQQGRALPLTWRIDVIDGSGQVCARVAFEAAILEKNPKTSGTAFPHRGPQPIAAMLGLLDEYRRAHTLLVEAHKLMRTRLEEQRDDVVAIG